MKLFSTFLFLCFFIPSAYAQVTVAFLRSDITEYTPGGQFYHTALSYNGSWIHAHPFRGVELINDIESVFGEAVYITHPTLNEPSQLEIEKMLSQKFDLTSPWKSDYSTYCSKLIGRHFNLKPSIMLFASPAWDAFRDRLPVGQLGMSPDEVFTKLINKHEFKLVNTSSQSMSCSKALAH